VARLDPVPYEQEAACVAALFARLDAVVDHSPDFTLDLKSTVVTDRGPNGAESRCEADFGIVASIVSKRETTEEAVLGRAKRGSLIDFPPQAAQEFPRQVVKMSAATRTTIGLEVPTASGVQPTVIEVATMRGTLPI
jgi:hypothetical protein